jgi:hypothetical protein
MEMSSQPHAPAALTPVPIAFWISKCYFHTWPTCDGHRFAGLWVLEVRDVQICSLHSRHAHTFIRKPAKCCAFKLKASAYEMYSYFTGNVPLELQTHRLGTKKHTNIEIIYMYYTRDTDSVKYKHCFTILWFLNQLRLRNIYKSSAVPQRTQCPNYKYQSVNSI